MSTEEPRVLSLASSRRKAAGKPIKDYVILLHNESELSVRADEWQENYVETDEGQAVESYSFYIEKARVLHLEGSEVRSIMDPAHVDATAIIAALKKKPRQPRKKGT